MLNRPVGSVLLAALCLAACVVGLVACWAAWPRTSNTSPLAALLALAWSGAFAATAVLTWRRSRLAAPAFLVSMGFPLLLVWFLFPGDGQSFRLPLYVAACLAGLLGFRYLGKVSLRAA